MWRLVAALVILPVGLHAASPYIRQEKDAEKHVEISPDGHVATQVKEHSHSELLESEEEELAKHEVFTVTDAPAGNTGASTPWPGTPGGAPLIACSELGCNEAVLNCTYRITPTGGAQADVTISKIFNAGKCAGGSVLDLGDKHGTGGQVEDLESCIKAVKGAVDAGTCTPYFWQDYDTMACHCMKSGTCSRSTLDTSCNAAAPLDETANAACFNFCSYQLLTGVP